MQRNGIALFAGLALATAWSQFLKSDSARAQFLPRVPPINNQRPFRMHAELIQWSGPSDDEAIAQVPTTLESEAPLPESLQIVSRVSGHAIRSYRHRIVREEQGDLLLSFVGRDGRRVRALLEVEGAPPDEALTLKLRLDRSYGAAHGRAVEALGPRGPWLRIDLYRP